MPKAPRFVVCTAKAPDRFGQLRRIAVVEMDGTLERPAMISARARGVVRIVREWQARLDPRWPGRGGFDAALAEAESLAAELNGA